VTVSLFGGAMLAAVGHREQVVVRDDEPAMVKESSRLAREGLRAFQLWNAAVRQGQEAQAARHNKRARVLLTRAMDVLNAVLDSYRDAGGMLRPEYEGYEVPLADLARHLIDLEKGALAVEGGSRTQRR
jgi:hypothetical protein